MAEKHSLRMVLPLEKLSVFYLLLQQGVWVNVLTGYSVASLLTDQFGIAEDYIIERVTTLFLDFKPVDDLKTSYVNDGSTLALSSAMPGLVGTTMRRGSHLAAMRGDISYQAQAHEVGGTGHVRIKLFNTVMTELGATILAQGIRLASHDLESLLSEQDDSFWQNSGGMTLDGQLIDRSGLLSKVGLAEVAADITLKVEFTN